ncbi:MAG: type II secretion system protein, partial [Clostridiales bacterium]|nr:type II secretion system protein [Clostridiales bacterium]
MNKQFSKRGFTIIEIAIALIVISILAELFIPSFLSVGVNGDLKVYRANCDGINLALDAAETLENVSEDVHELRQLLAEGGYGVDGLTMLTLENCLLWDASLNRALIVDIENELVVYPERYISEQNTGDWYDIATMQRYPCPDVMAREKFVELVKFYRGTLENAPKYTGEQANKRYAIMVAEMREVFRGFDKSAVCYAVYDRDSERLLNNVLKGFQVAKRTFAGTIPLDEYNTMDAEACT